MASKQKCSHCNHAEIRVMGVDCPTCFHEQRAKMQSAEQAYLQQKTREAVAGRRAPFHMYRSYTRTVANTNDFQHNDVRLYAQGGLPLLRKSELTNRMMTLPSFPAEGLNPMQAAEAISLHPLKAPPQPSQRNKADETDVFFDEVLLPESKYVILNGEVYRGSKPIQEDRVLYGIDSPMAAVHSAVREAMWRSASRKAPLSKDERTVDDSTDLRKRNESGSRQGNCKDEDESSDKVRADFTSKSSFSSVRGHRVVGVGNTESKISDNKSNAKPLLPEAEQSNEDARDGGRQGQWVSHHSSSHSHSAQRKRMSTKEDKHLSNNSKTKHGVVPQKPPKSHNERNRPRRRDEDRNNARRNSPLREKESSHRVPRHLDGVPDGEHVPPISKHRSRRDYSSRHIHERDSEKKCSKGSKKKSRAAEYNRRHADSNDSDNVLSSNSKSSRDDDFPLAKNGSCNRRESDCVITEMSTRPANKPRKKRISRRQHDKRHSPSLSIDSSQDGAFEDRRNTTRRDRNQYSDTDPEWSEESDTFLWSVLPSDSASSSASSSSNCSDTSPSSSENDTSRKPHHRHGSRRRGGGHRLCSLSNSSTSTHSVKAEEHRRKPKRGNERKEVDKSKRTKVTHRTSRPSFSASSSSMNVHTPRPGSGMDRPHQGRLVSPLRPPALRAVEPRLPNGVLPLLTEEMIPSTRYEPSCPSPVAHVPQLSSSLSTPLPFLGMTAEKQKDGCVSPALGQPRKDEERVSANNPLRRAYDEMPAEPLQLTRFNDLRHPSIASSLPVCSPSQGPLSLPPRKRNSTVAWPSSAPNDLDQITEHVLRVICDRLACGEKGGCGRLLGFPYPQQDIDPALTKSKAKAEEQRKEQEKAAESKRCRAEMLRLRQLLHEIQEAIRYLKDAKVPLNDFTTSLQFAFDQVTQFVEDDSIQLDIDDVATSHTFPVSAVASSSVHIVADGETDFPPMLKDVSAAKVLNLDVGTETVERLLKELHNRRTKHETLLREAKAEEERKAMEDAERQQKAAEEAERQQKAAEEAERQQKAAEEAERQQKAAEEAERQQKAAEEAERQQKAAEEAEQQRKAKEQQHAQEVAAFLFQETSARTTIGTEEKSAYDQLIVNAAKSEDYIHKCSIAAQMAQFENERTELFEEELGSRAAIVATEKEDVEDFWDVASQLWQAAADDAEEAERKRQEQQAAAEAEEATRRKSAAWQAAQEEEAARLQAEIAKMEAAAADAERSRNRKRYLSRSSSKSRLVRSNLIPNQMLDVSEEDGKIRLVGDPYIAAVEARQRERRRADRLRQERLASALGVPPPTSAGRPIGSVGPEHPSKEPSTRISIVGSGVTPAVKKSGQNATRASSRRSQRTSRSYSSAGGGNGRLNQVNRMDIPPSSGRLHSQSNFEVDDELNLGVEGQHVGTPPKTRSRASSIASVGVPLMGGIFNVATPYKNHSPDNETDALTSSSAVEALF